MVSAPPERAGSTGAGSNPERPILVDLMSVGVYANSVWDLVGSPSARRARTVLEWHLDYGAYPDEVLDGIRLALVPGRP